MLSSSVDLIFAIALLQVNLDLNLGLNNVIRKNQDVTKAEKMKHFLKWILLNLHKLEIKNNEKIPQPKLVCNISVILKIK